MDYAMERVCSHMQMETFIQDGGDLVRKMEQVHTHSHQTGWNYMDFGRMVNRKCRNGYFQTGPIIKELLQIISQMGRGLGILKTEIRLVDSFSRRE